MNTEKWPLRSLALHTLSLALILTLGACKKQQDSGQNTNPQGSAHAATQQAPPGQVPLALDLPTKVFRGTPKDIVIENLEPASAERPPLMVPQGTKLLSLNQPVTSSDENPVIGWLDLVTDGDKEAMDGSWVELGPFVQWVQIDLGLPQKISAVVVWHEHSYGVVYKDVVVQVADDPDFVTNVRTLFNNDIDNSAGLGTGKDMHYLDTSEGKLIAVDGLTAQYVRLYSNGNTANDINRYTEVEVYGTCLE